MNYRNLDWDAMLDYLAQHSWVVLDNFLEPQEMDLLLQEFKEHRIQNDLHRAGIGNSYLYLKDKEVRGDSIVWIDKQNSAGHTLAFYNRMVLFMQELNRGLLLSMKEIEAHFALYPPGALYQRHVDQFKNNGHRILSFACYLNKNWKEGDGGELEILDGDDVLLFPPLAGRLALFRSDVVEHAVLKSNVNRVSITGWMLDRPIDLPIHY